jgi:hypothetical protein
MFVPLRQALLQVSLVVALMTGAANAQDADEMMGFLIMHLIGKPATIKVTHVGCKTRADFDRLLKFQKANDALGIGQFDNRKLATGECVMLLLGDAVRVDDGDVLDGAALAHICVRPEGQRVCFWTMIGAVTVAYADLNTAAQGECAAESANAEHYVDAMFDCLVAHGVIKGPAPDAEAVGKKQAADRTIYLLDDDPDAKQFVAMIKAMTPQDQKCFDAGGASGDMAPVYACLRSHGWRIVNGRHPQ